MKPFIRHNGFSLVEILVTIVILMVGLLGLAGLQGHALTAQTESYQRSQALILVKDMADRIRINYPNAAFYITSDPVGTNASAPSSTNSIADADLNEWHDQLQGSAEVQTGTGTNVGAMIGARGCVYQLVAPASGVAAEYLVAVAWQGLTPTAAPTVDCGEGLYGANDRYRRVVTYLVSLGDLIQP